MTSVNDFDNSVPDADHIQMVVQGFIDTLSGQESLSLTNAQRYTYGVMYASGEVRNSDVAGNEGFFDQLSAGIKKMWEYIVKMATSIGNFFTGGSSKKESDKVENSAAAVDKALAAVSNPKVTPNNVDSVVKSVEKVIDKIPEGPEKKELEKKMEAIKAEENSTKKVQDVVHIVSDAFEKSTALQLKLKNHDKKLNDQLAQMHQRLEDYRSKAEDKSLSERVNRVADSLADDIQTLLNGIKSLPTDIKNISTVSSAREFIQKAKRCTQAMNNNLENVRTTNASQRSRMQDTKKILDSKPHHDNWGELQETLTGYQLGMQLSSTVIKATTAIFDTLTLVYSTLEHACSKVDSE